jgi:hypothetical protein
MRHQGSETSAATQHFSGLITNARNLTLLERANIPTGVLIRREQDYQERIAIWNHSFQNAAIAYPRNHAARLVAHPEAAIFLSRELSSSESIASMAPSERRPEHKRGEDGSASQHDVRPSMISLVASYQV